MKFETIKSFILLILVVLSILLTFGIWYYQPAYDELYDEDEVSELETDIGGEQNDLDDIIKPDTMVFHDYREDDPEYFSFDDPKERLDLYEDMQSWSLSDFESVDSDEIPAHQQQIEIQFPTEIPMKILDSMFSLDDDETLPGWEFEKFFIGLDEDLEELTLTFESTDDGNIEVASVHDENTYDMLAEYMSSDDDMEPLIPFRPPETNEEPIYIPADPSDSMNRYALTVDDTDPNKLINALFSKPSLVNNPTEESFTDGQRSMDLHHDGRTAEFIDPYSSEDYEKMDVPDLIERSLEQINDHRGWTNDYYLDDLDSDKNHIEYRMHYKEYPVYSYSDLSIIEQKWRDKRIYKYERPLFQLKNVLPQEDTKELASGNEVIETISDNPNYEPSKVRDIKIGYALSYEDKATQSVTLEPAWYVNYSGSWREVNLDDTDDEKE